nr:hypothetical protein [uncultured Rhodopila sp.]
MMAIHEQRRSRHGTAGARALLTAAAFFAAPAAAVADTIDAAYAPAGQTAADFSRVCAGHAVCDFGTENFSGWSGASPYVSLFDDAGAGTFSHPAGVSFTGVFAAGPGTSTGSGGEWVSVPQNQYGGADGLNYPELYGGPARGLTNVSSYTLALSATGVRGVNYFGIWLSAVDSYNDLTLYDGTAVVADIDGADVAAAVGACAWWLANAYCGNPTPQFSGQDPTEQFVYLNVFDLTGFITGARLSDSGPTGFEATNVAVAYAGPSQAPAPLAVASLRSAAPAIPEPAPAPVFLLAMLSLLAACAVRRRPNRAAAPVGAAGGRLATHGLR